MYRDDSRRALGFPLGDFKAQNALDGFNTALTQRTYFIDPHTAVSTNSRYRLHLVIKQGIDLCQLSRCEDFIADLAAFGFECMTTPRIVLWCIVIAIACQIPYLRQCAYIVLDGLSRNVWYSLLYLWQS